MSEVGRGRHVRPCGVAHRELGGNVLARDLVSMLPLVGPRHRPFTFLTTFVFVPKLDDCACGDVSLFEAQANGRVDAFAFLDVDLDELAHDASPLRPNTKLVAARIAKVKAPATWKVARFSDDASAVLANLGLRHVPKM